MNDEIQVQLSKASCLFQIDGFPKDARRSIEGSLHFRPGICRFVTPDELKFIKARFPGYYDQLRILKVEKPEVQTSKPIPSVSSKEENKTELPKRRSETESKPQPRKTKSKNREDAD